MLTSLQILILKLLFYFREPATEHVILAPGYPRKTYIANKLQIFVYVWYVSFYCRALHVATVRGHGDFVCHGDKPALLLLHLTIHLVNVVSSNNQFNFEFTCVTTGAYNQNINKRQVHKLIWHAMVCKFYNSKYYF